MPKHPQNWGDGSALVNHMPQDVDFPMRSSRVKKIRNYGVCILFLCFSPSFAQAADGYLVQLGSFPSEDAASKGWARIQGQQKDLLATMTSSFQRADLGSKGVFFRIHAGPLASESAAKKICAELTKRKVGCLVIKP